MTESNQSTIPIRPIPDAVSTIETPDTTPDQTPTNYTRRIIVASVALVIMVVGWLSWPNSGADDDLQFADLDEIDSSAPALGLPAPADASVANRSLNLPNIAPPDASETLASMRSSFEVPIGDDRSSHPNVWLTGTIEEDVPTQKSPRPLRISGEPNEAAAYR